MMNKQQKNYAKAKALVGALEAQEDRIEREYIKDHGITNPNGSTPEHIYCIEDEDVFNIANEATAPEIDALGIYEAREILKQAEDDLIRYALSIVPAKVRETLSERCFGLNGKTILLNIRSEVIDAAFKLDVATVRQSP